MPKTEKPERDWFIRAADNITLELTAERRAQLAQKGQVLYRKYCGLKGNGICAESFAEYHMLRDEHIVVSDFLEFLYCARLIETDPAKIHITDQLIARIEALF